MPVVVTHSLATCLLLLGLCACKQQAPAPSAIESAPHPAERQAPAQVEAPPPPQAPVRDPFELEDEPDDPAEALRAMRHNCCDEMPPDEIRAGVDEAEEPAKPLEPRPARH